jgi:probable phosphoglycerate mutase
MTGRLVLVRHGETVWSEERKHTGRSDVPLTEHGRAQAQQIAGALKVFDVQRCFASPLVRAWESARLIGLEPERDDDLLEWDYGDYEGLTTAEIRDSVTGWSVWTHPITGGESIEQVGARADRVIDRLHRLDGTTALVAHSHLLRILAARWLELPPVEGRRFTLDNTTISVLGWERENRVVARWNDPATWTGLPADYQAISGNP